MIREKKNIMVTGTLQLQKKRKSIAKHIPLQVDSMAAMGEKKILFSIEHLKVIDLRTILTSVSLLLHEQNGMQVGKREKR